MAAPKHKAAPRAANRSAITKKGYWTGCNQPAQVEYVPMVYVYVLECEMRVKVGVALDVERRRKQIEYHCPFPVRKAFSRKVFAHVAGDIEHAAHVALSTFHVHGEWFACATTAAIQALSRAILTHGKKPAPEGWALPVNGIPGPRLSDIRDWEAKKLRASFLRGPTAAEL